MQRLSVLHRWRKTATVWGIVQRARNAMAGGPRRGAVFQLIQDSDVCEKSEFGNFGYATLCRTDKFR